jgi:hypothetical protein
VGGEAGLIPGQTLRVLQQAVGERSAGGGRGSLGRPPLDRRSSPPTMKWHRGLGRGGTSGLRPRPASAAPVADACDEVSHVVHRRSCSIVA